MQLLGGPFEHVCGTVRGPVPPSGAHPRVIHTTLRSVYPNTYTGARRTRHAAGAVHAPALILTSSLPVPVRSTRTRSDMGDKNTGGTSVSGRRLRWLLLACASLAVCLLAPLAGRRRGSSFAASGDLALPSLSAGGVEPEEFIITRSSRPQGRQFYVHVHNTRKCKWLSESILNTGSVEDDILDIIEKALAPGGLADKLAALGSGMSGAGKQQHFVDVGANIGYITLFAAALDPSIHVTAVEAMPWHYQLLEASLCRNPGLAARVKLFKVGLGPEDVGQSLCMSAEAHNAAATSASLGACAPGAGVTVPMTTLDAVLAKSWPIQPDFLKIDVEGFEPLIFKGAQQLLARPPAVILSELVPFRVQRVIPEGQDPFAAFFGLFPSAAFDVKVINQGWYNLTDGSSYDQTVARLRALSEADKSFAGGNLVITPRGGGGRRPDSAAR